MWKNNKADAAKALLHRIDHLYTGEPVRFMEVCGTHTVSIFREGLRQVLPKGIHLVSGPGCPVCVTDQAYMDKAIAYAKQPHTIVATFGDMLKVPGTHSTLWEAKAQGAQIAIVYSPMDVLALGEAHPDDKIVFLGIGFETTIAAIAGTIRMVHAKGLKNVFFLISHKLVGPALRALLTQQEGNIQGFLLPGHVSVIIGEEPYQFVAKEFHVPGCIAGFDGIEILMAVENLLTQRKEGVAYIGNTYPSVVMKEGNRIAQQWMDEMYDVIDDRWRGIGVIPGSGLRLRAPYDVYDIEQVHPLTEDLGTKEPVGCQCGRVLQGLIEPTACALFGTACTPDHPVGACMVSVEGSCAAWYTYHQASGGLTWEE